MNLLEEAIALRKTGRLLFILDDFNAKLGAEVGTVNQFWRSFSINTDVKTNTVQLLKTVN